MKERNTLNIYFEKGEFPNGVTMNRSSFVPSISTKVSSLQVRVRDGSAMAVFGSSYYFGTQ